MVDAVVTVEEGVLPLVDDWAEGVATTARLSVEAMLVWVDGRVHMLGPTRPPRDGGAMPATSSTIGKRSNLVTLGRVPLQKLRMLICASEAQSGSNSHLLS